MGKHSIHFNLILDGERGPHAPGPPPHFYLTGPAQLQD